MNVIYKLFATEIPKEVLKVWWCAGRRFVILSAVHDKCFLAAYTKRKEIDEGVEKWNGEIPFVIKQINADLSTSPFAYSNQEGR